jgi:hypothetical protein
MLISDLPIYVPPSLSRVFGFNEAAVIQEIHFWLNPNVSPHFSPYFKDGRYWVPEIFEHLYQKFSFWDEDTISYMCAEFEQSGILMRLNVKNSLQDLGTITYHTLNYEVLRKMIGAKPVPASSSMDEGRPTHDLAANKNINTQSSFSVETHKRAPDVYAMEVQDFHHFLACELLLEIQDRTEKVDGQPPVDDRLPVDAQLPVHTTSKKPLEKEEMHESLPDGLLLMEVICHFPKIFDVQLKEFIWGDITLYKIVMVTFQMNVLEQLFSFCEAHKASKLVIFADNDDELGVYKDFLVHKDESKNIYPAGGKWEEERGEKAGIVIPVSRDTLDVWACFMKAITIRFRQVLLNEQKTNPAIQNYLKLFPLPE